MIDVAAKVNGVRRRGHIRDQRRGAVIAGANRAGQSRRGALAEAARRRPEQDRRRGERDRRDEGDHRAHFERSGMARDPRGGPELRL